MKRGMTVQPFLFIMALVVMAFVITFGTKSVLDLKRSADFTEIGIFIDALDDEVEKFYNFDVGSSKNIAFLIPAKVTTMCFANRGEPLTAGVPDRLLREVLRGEGKSNVFFLPIHAFPKTDFYIEHLRAPEQKNPLCLTTRGKLEAALTTVLYEGRVYVELQSR